MSWASQLTFVAALAAFSSAAVAQPTFEPGCDAGSSIKVTGTINAVEVTGVGGQASQTLVIHLSDKKAYSSRADVSAGLFAAYVALFTAAYFDKKPVTIQYGCEVGLRIIHSVELP